jgi:hypothetical protein
VRDGCAVNVNKMMRQKNLNKRLLALAGPKEVANISEKRTACTSASLFEVTAAVPAMPPGDDASFPCWGHLGGAAHSAHALPLLGVRKPKCMFLIAGGRICFLCRRKNQAFAAANAARLVHWLRRIMRR